jgi:hypothetical protein
MDYKKISDLRQESNPPSWRSVATHAINLAADIFDVFNQE